MQTADGDSGSGAGGGGRGRMTTFCLCKDKLLIIFIVVILANLSRLYYKVNERHADITLGLIQENHILSRYGFNEGEIRSVFTFIAANNNFLVRRTGRTPDLNIHFEEHAAEADRLLHLNIQGDQRSLEDNYYSLVRILRHIQTMLKCLLLLSVIFASCKIFVSYWQIIPQMFDNLSIICK
jgi:hypothetical protein